MDFEGGIVEAVVLTAGFETPYRRSGRGAPVLLLEAGPGLLEPLARRFRVTELLGLTDPARGTGALAEWLGGVVDGLGLDRPAVVAGPAWLDAVQRVAAADGERFGPVLSAGEPDAVLDALASIHETIDF